jgi:hypothetical protein
VDPRQSRPVPNEEHSEWLVVQASSLWRSTNGLPWERMKPEYDFSKAEIAKFSRPNAELRLPIYLNPDVQAYLADRAAQQGIPLGEMANTLLKKIMKSAK